MSEYCDCLCDKGQGGKNLVISREILCSLSTGWHYYFCNTHKVSRFVGFISLFLSGIVDNVVCFILFLYTLYSFYIYVCYRTVDAAIKLFLAVSFLYDKFLGNDNALRQFVWMIIILLLLT